jgi:hypothetical protein
MLAALDSSSVARCIALPLCLRGHDYAVHQKQKMSAKLYCSVRCVVHALCVTYGAASLRSGCEPSTLLNAAAKQDSGAFSNLHGKVTNSKGWV